MHMKSFHINFKIHWLRNCSALKSDPQIINCSLIQNSQNHCIVATFPVLDFQLGPDFSNGNCILDHSYNLIQYIDGQNHQRGAENQYIYPICKVSESDGNFAYLLIFLCRLRSLSMHNAVEQKKVLMCKLDQILAPELN